MENLLKPMAIITETMPADNLSGMWAAVITGLVVVFLILALLIAFLSLIGLFSKIGDRKKVDLPFEDEKEPVLQQVIAETEEQDENDEEIIAVISAAIAAYSQQDGKAYTIKKIKRSEKQPRSSWGNAGVIENTRPF